MSTVEINFGTDVVAEHVMPVVAPVVPIFTTKHVAAIFGITPMQLRRILRTMPEYADGVHTNYAWPDLEGSIARIRATVTGVQTKRAAAQVAAQAAIVTQPVAPVAPVAPAPVAPVLADQLAASLAEPTPTAPAPPTTPVQPATRRVK